MGRLAVGQIVAIVLYFCPGRGLLLSGKRQTDSMDGSLLIWLAALIPLHATLMRYQSQYSAVTRCDSSRFAQKCSAQQRKKGPRTRVVTALGFFFIFKLIVSRMCHCVQCG